MKQYKVLFLIPLFTVFCVLAPALFAQQGSMNWTQATANAGWTGRYGHTSVVFDNKMWMIGGYYGSGYTRDVWYSTGMIITILTPNGGEVWPGGTYQTIKWRTVGSGFARYRLL